MQTTTSGINETISATAVAVAEISALMLAVDESKVNTIPFAGSWTAPQLLRHVTKSINGMANALQLDAKPTDRNPGERIEQLKKIFLDRTNKFTQPDFLIPEERIYEKQAAIEELNTAFSRFVANAESANTNELVEGLPLGPITKLEIIYFTQFHTQRHLQQMENICEALKDG